MLSTNLEHWWKQGLCENGLFGLRGSSLVKYYFPSSWRFHFIFIISNVKELSNSKALF